jgi:putative ABC transport system permease protein
MSSNRNIAAAYQVVRALPGRTLLLALPVAFAIGLGMTTLAMDRSVEAKAREDTESWGSDQVVLYGSGKQIAGKSGDSLTDADVKALRDKLRGVKKQPNGVPMILPTRRMNESSLSFGSKSGKYKLYAVTPPWAEARHFPAERGRFFNDDDMDSNAAVCLLGQTTVQDLFGTQDPIGQKVKVNTVEFEVIGVLVARGSSPGEGNRDARILVPLTTFKERLDPKKSTYAQIICQAADTSEDHVERIARDAAEIVRAEHRLGDKPDDFDVRNAVKFAREARHISRGVFFLLLGLAGVTALVAITVVAVIFHHATRDRRQEIGLRRAIGAESGDILQQIWAEGLLISLLGGIFGLGLGLVAILAVGKWMMPADVPLRILDPAVLIIPLLLVLLTSLAGLFAARTAAQLDPAQALRPAA